MTDSRPIAVGDYPDERKDFAMTIRPKLRLRLSSETLRFLATRTVDTSRGLPCHTHGCSDGPPCTGSAETCP